jgi:hypothetical protein
MDSSGDGEKRGGEKRGFHHGGHGGTARRALEGRGRERRRKGREEERKGRC